LHDRPEPPADRDRALSRAARRNPADFDLYRKYLPQVYSFALYELRDPHAAEDATERVFMQALAALPGFEERADTFAARGDAGNDADASTFRVWLFRIARNVVANERRRDRRRPVALLERPPAAASGDVAETGPAGRARLAAVARLPETAAARSSRVRGRDVHGRDRGDTGRSSGGPRPAPPQRRWRRTLRRGLN
jgi:RNA polymerase sigma-70 factor (ECF subfamily)